MASEKEPLVFHGSKWRSFAFSMVYASIGLAVGVFLFSIPSLSYILILLGSTIGMAALGFSFMNMKKLDVVFVKDMVEGSGTKGPFRNREVIPIQEIDIEASRFPSKLRAGYLTSVDGKRILVSGAYFTGRQSSEIFAEVSRRQSNE